MVEISKFFFPFYAFIVLKLKKKNAMRTFFGEHILLLIEQSLLKFSENIFARERDMEIPLYSIYS